MFLWMLSWLFKYFIVLIFFALINDNCRFVEKIFLNYTIEAEKFSGAVISRVFFKGSPAEENYVLHKSIQLKEQSKPEFSCKEHLVYIIVS